MLPYLLTILVLILSAWRGRRIDAPAALGTNIEPEG
jgi:simple sugar transport system permease protein